MTTTTKPPELTEQAVQQSFNRVFGVRPARQTHVALECRLTTLEAAGLDAALAKLESLVKARVVTFHAGDDGCDACLTGMAKVRAALAQNATPFDEA